MRNRNQKKSPGKEKEDSTQVVRNKLAPEPLGEFRNNALESLQNMVKENGIEVLEVFQAGYIKEDWDWLIENLETKH